jgi:hypothetical protein
MWRLLWPTRNACSAGSTFDPSDIVFDIGDSGLQLGVALPFLPIRNVLLRDVEIALADEERVFRGFEALLGVGKSGVVQGKEVISDAEEYIADRKEWEGYSKLETRVADIEHDITGS